MGEAPAKRVVRLRLLMLQYGEMPYNTCKFRNLIRRLRRLPSRFAHYKPSVCAPFLEKAFARHLVQTKI